MPATCKDVTTPDGALCSLQMAPFISRIHVLPDYHFDVHKVILVDADFPTGTTIQNRFHMPRTFLEFEMDTEQVAKHFQAQSEKAETLAQWGKQVENAIHETLKQDPQHPRGLPKAFRGCGKRPRFKQVPIRTLTPAARAGDYHPPSEVHTFATRRKVQQCRRLQSLVHGLAKSNHTDKQLANMQGEWAAILKCVEFAPDFATWVMTQLQWCTLPCRLPSHDLAHDIFQLVQHHTNIAVAFDKKVWLSKLEYGRKMDAQYRGYSRAHARHWVTPLQHPQS